jgi:hypothetical protein
MQRTRRKRASHYQSLVRAADAGRSGAAVVTEGLKVHGRSEGRKRVVSDEAGAIQPPGRQSVSLVVSVMRSAFFQSCVAPEQADEPDSQIASLLNSIAAARGLSAAFGGWWCNMKLKGLRADSHKRKQLRVVSGA